MAKAKPGTVSIQSRNGLLSLRWRYEGKEFSLSTGLRDTPYHRTITQRKQALVQRDIDYGEFDQSLEKYRDRPTEQREQLTTVELWQRFTEYRKNEGTSGQAIASRYHPLLANLKRFGKDIVDESTARQFIDLLRSRQSPRIANQNLSLLRGFADWAIKQCQLENNPFTEIKPQKVTRDRSSRKPFTREEVQLILSTIRLDSHCYHYHDFVLTLFSLGLRPSEAIGLRWKHIDFTRKQVTICESLSRAEDGNSAGYARQRKTTKTGEERILDLSERLSTVLMGRRLPDSQPDDLVFTTNGKPIDDHNFSQKCWKRILKTAGIEYRPPYAARHTLGSWMIEDGATLPQTAHILGHKTARMVSETYGHMINRPKMPEL